MRNNTILFKQFALNATVITMLSGCGGSSSSTPDIPTVPEPQPSAPVDEYLGVWQQVGYGLYLDVGANEVRRYEASSDSCLLTHTFSRTEFPSKLNWTFDEVTEQRIAYHEYNNLDLSYHVVKSQQLPTSCDEPITIGGANNTPSNVVNHLISMATEYYAFFDERDIDWNAASSRALSQVDDDMSDAELKELLHELMSVFNDQHVLLHSATIDILAPDFDFEAVEVFGSRGGFAEQIIVEYLLLSIDMPLHEYYLQELAKYYTSIDNMLDDGVKSAGGEGSDKLQWGTIGNEIGYLHVRELDYFDPNVATSFIDNLNPAHEAALNQVLDMVVEDFENTKGIVIDLRMHSGGTTSLDRAIAKRFLQQETVYGSYSMASGEEINELTMSPYSGARLNQPVVVITSDYVVSSGEDMVMALKAGANAAHVGVNTAGALSDMQFLSLPNEWLFSLSNQVWYDNEGSVLEVQGITPEFRVEVFSKSDREHGIDSALNKAIELLQ